MAIMTRRILALVVGLMAGAVPASAQVDPLLFIKDAQPYVLFVVDTANRMQRDAPTATDEGACFTPSRSVTEVIEEVVDRPNFSLRAEAVGGRSVGPNGVANGF